jgi:hypothetical protein
MRYSSILLVGTGCTLHSSKNWLENREKELKKLAVGAKMRMTWLESMEERTELVSQMTNWQIRRRQADIR